MKETKDQDTEAKILKAATEVFQQKGFSGAKMQEIADKVGINRALLHYYFRSKENLFQGILKNALQQIFPKVNAIFMQEISLMEKIALFVGNYIDFLQKNPHLPLFILHELQQNPENITEIFLKDNRPNITLFAQQIQLEVTKGNIRSIDPRNLVVNIISLCVFPVIARPIMSELLKIGNENYDNFLTERKQQIVKFIEYSLKP